MLSLFRFSLCLFSLSVVGLLGESSKAADRPNVLMILVDDLKPAMGCYGDKIAVTPHMDRLASQGMRFDLAYCNQAVCAPSRFTLMLGAHSTSTGLYGLGSQLREILPNAITLPQYFARHGYRTESLGKVFHIGHGNHGDPASFMVPHFHDKVIEYLDPDSTNGGMLTREEAYFTNQKLGQIRSLPRGAAFESPEVADIDYADGRVAAETVNRLAAAKQRRAAEGTPFFIVAGFARPHLPFSAPKKYWDLYRRQDLPMPTHEDLPVDAPSVAGKRGGEISNYKPVPADANEAFGDELKRDLIHGYYASMSYVDAQIGKVLSELDRLGLTEDTIVVLWGDHGFHLGDLGIWTKHTNYEQANRIPILFSAPGRVASGASTRQLAESVDVFPTLVELAGLPDAEVPQSLDGVSLVPVLEDPEVRVRNHAYHAYPKRKLGRAIRTERYRLVQWLGEDAPADQAEYELYDYENDPGETHNLAAQEAAVVVELAKILQKYPKPISKDPARARLSHLSQPTLLVDTPDVANTTLHLWAEIERLVGDGVIAAQGGREHGYSLHVVDGRLAFDVRIDGIVKRVQCGDKLPSACRVEAWLSDESLEIAVDGKVVAKVSSAGLIPVQPKDGLSIGFDDLSAAGDYQAPNPLNGIVRDLKIDTGATKK
ncbi:MAG: sulfatase [Rubripirellula sp.]